MGLAYTTEAIGFLKKYIMHPDRYLPMCDQVWEIFNEDEFPGHLVGWNAGVIDGNRPFFYYASAIDKLINYVIFISADDIPDTSNKALVPYLCKEGLLDTLGPKKEEAPLWTFIIKSKSGKEFLSINLTGEGDLRAYEGGYFLPFEGLNEFNSTRDPLPEPEPVLVPKSEPKKVPVNPTTKQVKKKTASRKPTGAEPKRRGRPPKAKRSTNEEIPKDYH